MKLIFLTSRFPYPLEKGDKLRSYFLLKELSRYHEIILVSLNENKVKNEHIAHLENIVSKVYVFPLSLFSRYYNTLLAFFSGRPLQAGYFYNCRINRQIRKIIREESPDHIFCQLLRTALYVKGVSIPKTIDYQDVFSYGIKRRLDKSTFPFSLVLRLEYSRLKKFESRIFSWFDHRLIITETDRDLMPVAHKEKIHIISNGVDFEYFDYNAFTPAEKTYDILFTGNMGYPPNVDCAMYIAKKILPLLKIKFPEIRIVFAGANPHPSLLKLNHKQIVVTGWVEDMREYYASAKVFAAPMQIGTGLQNKLLEAMAMKIPCVTSELANSALGAENGNEILVGDTPEAVAEHIMNLLNNNDYSAEIALNGYHYVKNNFSWNGQVAKLHSIIMNEADSTI
jgi:polysaccharide biosynthesis protein PslH